MMLKKALAASAVALLIAPTMAHAQRKYGMAGCGLGSVVMGPKAHRFRPIPRTAHLERRSMASPQEHQTASPTEGAQ